MESLVRYKRLLVAQHAETVGKEAVQSLVDSCLELLEKLRAIDPPRRRRYEEIGEQTPRASEDRPRLYSQAIQAEGLKSGY